MKDDGSFIETSSAQQSSYEISCNAKGDYAWKIKCYCDDDTEAEARMKEMKKTIDAILEE